MSESVSDLEKEVEESRARLDRTIDRLQDRLSPVNLVDEMIGSARRSSGMNDVYDNALEAVRRNPLPVLLIAAGVGLLLRGMSGRTSDGARRLPVVTEPTPSPTSRAVPERSYDPDQPVGRPARALDSEAKA